MGHSAHCAWCHKHDTVARRAFGCAAFGRASAQVEGKLEGRGSRRVGSSVAVGEFDAVSLLALRTRAVRLWLAAIGLAGFALAYAQPIGLALTQPAASSATVLPSLSLPLVSFPS